MALPMNSRVIHGPAVLEFSKRLCYSTRSAAAYQVTLRVGPGLLMIMI
jgi:hypothetical protein